MGQRGIRGYNTRIVRSGFTCFKPGEVLSMWHQAFSDREVEGTARPPDGSSEPWKMGKGKQGQEKCYKFICVMTRLFQ